MVLDLDRLLDFAFWTRFGFTLSTKLLVFFLCGFRSRPAFGLRLLDTFRVHIEHWTFVLFLCGFGFGPASALRFLDMIRDHVEPRTFRFFSVD